MEGEYVTRFKAGEQRTPARAIVFEPGNIESFGRECASLAKANAVGAGPTILKIVARTENWLSDEAERRTDGDAAFLPRPVIIEEDAGVSLEKLLFWDKGAAIPGPTSAPLHEIGTLERDMENAKIEFDVFCQLHNLHSSGMFHRDLRAANVCVRRYGPAPADIRATLIDFELVADVAQSRLEAAAKEDYLDVIFPGKSYLLPVEIDMGYLAAFCFELETERPVRKAGPDFFAGELYPFFRLSGGTVYVQRITQADLDALATEVGLIPVDEEGIGRLAGERLELPDLVDCVSAQAKHGGYLDSKDIALLNEDPEYVILSNRERIALESFETYKEQVRGQGGTPEYEGFFDQPKEMQQTALDNITKYRAKAERFGYRIVLKTAVGYGDKVIPKFEDVEMEQLAKMEHDRWMAQKISQGYQRGDIKDEEAKTHPCLVPYEELPENEKDKDRRNIRNMIPFLEELGLVICR